MVFIKTARENIVEQRVVWMETRGDTVKQI